MRSLRRAIRLCSFDGFVLRGLQGHLARGPSGVPQSRRDDMEPRWLPDIERLGRQLGKWRFRGAPLKSKEPSTPKVNGTLVSQQPAPRLPNDASGERGPKRLLNQRGGDVRRLHAHAAGIAQTAAALEITRESGIHSKPSIEQMTRKMLNIVIHKADHERDDIGHLFRDACDARELRRHLRTYLGVTLSIIRVRIEASQLKVCVASSDFEERRSDERVRIATRLAARGHRQAAMDQLQNALTLFPLNGAALSRLGQAYYARAEYAEAMRLFVRATEVLSDDSAPLRALGTICLRTRELGKSLRYFRRAVIVDPSDQAARFAVGVLREHIAGKTAPSMRAVVGIHIHGHHSSHHRNRERVVVPRH